MLQARTDLVFFLAITLHCSGLSVQPRTIPNTPHQQHLSAATPVAPFFYTLLSRLSFSVLGTVRKRSLSSNRPKPICPRHTAALVTEQELIQCCRDRLNYSLPRKSVGWTGLYTAATPAIAHYFSPRAAKEGLTG